MLRKSFFRLCETSLLSYIWHLTLNIEIQILIFSASPRWRLELRDAVINRPNTLRLSCEVAGNPTPTFQWEKDSKTLTATERMKITQESQRSTLEITNSAFEDSGVYTCTAKNEHGHVTTSCIAQVRGNLNICIVCRVLNFVWSSGWCGSNLAGDNKFFVVLCSVRSL